MGLIMLSRIFAASAIAAALGAASPAFASDWSWGCIGKLGADRVVFNRSALVVWDANETIKLKELKNSSLDLEPRGGYQFTADDNNSGLAPKLEFTLTTDKATLKVVLTELKSKTLSDRTTRSETREYYNKTFKKTYRYERTGEKPRTLAMDCIEFEISAPIRR
jgi:hypothetical protein